MTRRWRWLPREMMMHPTWREPTGQGGGTAPRRYANSLEWERANVARAVEWTSFLFDGFGRKFKLTHPTLAEAERGAECLNETFATGVRRAIIYAVTPEGWSFQVSEENRP